MTACREDTCAKREKNLEVYSDCSKNQADNPEKMESREMHAMKCSVPSPIRVLLCRREKFEVCILKETELLAVLS